MCATGSILNVLACDVEQRQFLVVHEIHLQVFVPEIQHRLTHFGTVFESDSHCCLERRYLYSLRPQRCLQSAQLQGENRRIFVCGHEFFQLIAGNGDCGL